jgi:hypothetical protein
MTGMDSVDATEREVMEERSSRYKRPAIAGGIIAAAAIVISVWPRPWPVITTPSGRRITHVVVGHFIVPNDSPVLRLKYETTLPLSDTVALKAEARELWEQFRYDVQRGGYVNAAFLPEAPPTGLCFRHAGFCKYEGYGFLARRREDGRFYFSNDTTPLP